MSTQTVEIATPSGRITRKSWGTHGTWAIAPYVTTSGVQRGLYTITDTNSGYAAISRLTLAQARAVLADLPEGWTLRSGVLDALLRSLWRHKISFLVTFASGKGQIEGMEGLP